MTHAPAPIIRAFFDEPTNTVSYLVADPATKKAAIIDPVFDYDHNSGTVDTRSVEAMLQGGRGGGLHRRMGAGDPCPCRPSVGCALHQGQDRREDRHRRAHQGRAEDLPPDLQRHRPRTDGSDFDHLFTDGERFTIGELDVEVLHTPGHTPADISYKVEDAVFVGDTMFMPDYGTARADFPGGDAASALSLDPAPDCALPAETRLFMCHDYKAPGRDDYAWETTVRDERENNVHLEEVSPRKSSSPCDSRATRSWRRRRCCCRRSRPTSAPAGFQRRRAMACIICSCRFARGPAPRARSSPESLARKAANKIGTFDFRSSCPASCRASTSLLRRARKTWMAGTSPAMTEEGHLEMLRAGSSRCPAAPRCWASGDR